MPIFNKGTNYNYKGRILNQIIISLLSILILGNSAYTQILPPEIPWDGASQKYIRAKSDPWVTPGERSGLTQSPDYKTTINWLKTLVNHSPHLTMLPIGKTFQNRDLWMVVASKEGLNSSAGLKRIHKPTILFHAGIHSGEIDGKDAGMMYLRDVVLERPDLLDSINFLFIPVINPDGHERSSAYNRVNQRGPEKIGWRTNARNLNLNRDFTKAETPEMKALLQIFRDWPVDLYIDIHVTDGIDYQYDITFGFNYWNCFSPNINHWLEDVLRPYIDKKLFQEGHIPGPLIFAKNKKNPREGIVAWSASPRFSNGYGDARHLPTILIENHSLKSFRQRVLGTYVFLDAVSKLIARKGRELQAEIARDALLRPNKIVLETDWKASTLLPDSIFFLGIEHRIYKSSISGIEEVEWLGKPNRYKSPVYTVSPKHQIKSPIAYWIPASRKDIIEKLNLHGIEMTIIKESVEIKVEISKIVGYKLATETFEGRVQIKVDSLVSESRLRHYPSGSARVSTDQPLGILATLLLEPRGTDSFLQWGYFHEIFQRTEYMESYAVAPLAEQMLRDSSDLREKFNLALKDTSFANDPIARLHWFYKRSPYYDKEYLVYPVGREY